MVSSLLDIVYDRVTQLPTMMTAKATKNEMKRELMFEVTPPVIALPIDANMNKKTQPKAARVTKEKTLVHLAALFTGFNDSSISSQNVVH
mmetsp:Transcript_35203/g.84091  ORF Transcript_35203/g.84091 Transcript_35203/m.84091 type:complete len:90 (-) Transcript_35203:436-705(-)